MRKSSNDAEERTSRRSRTSSTRSINQEPVSIDGFQLNQKKVYLSWLYTFLSLGFLQLVFFWRPDWKLRMTHIQCDLSRADKVFIADCYKQDFVETVHVDTTKHHLRKSRPEVLRYFIHKKIKYIWEERVDAFVQLRGFRENCPCSDLHEAASGLSEEEQTRRQHLFGENLIKVNVRPIAWLILHEALNPFYVFQLYTSIIWIIQDYLLYTAAVVVLAAISIGVTVYETRKQNKALRNRVKSSSDVNVYRGNNRWDEVSSKTLVPGDVIQVTANTTMECDAVLLNGSVIVNESMLTGESVPISKLSLPDNPDLMYNPDSNKRHTLYCGTKVLLTHGNVVRAIVIRTGFATAKGELVRSILFPKPVDMKFYSDSMRFMGISFLLGIIAMIYTTVSYALNDSSIKDIIINALDIITFVVPPSLPATMTIGNIYAQRRLKRQGIYCLSSKYINLSGTLNIVCFDKTGTLTHDGLDLEGVVGINDDKTLGRIHSAFDSQTLDYKLTHLMACCHSLDIIDDKVVGDPLDMVMFNATGWSMDDPDIHNETFRLPVSRVVLCEHSGNVAGLVHQYPFLSGLQRMSVIVEYFEEYDDDSHLCVYLKGAPETVASLCLPHTVPYDLDSALQRYTGEGYRVIALAWRPLPNSTSWPIIRDSRRDEIEVDMIFMGLLVLQNRLKTESAETIAVLHHANIRTVMVTGDNLLTAVHTARGCGMVLPSDDVVIVKAFPNNNYTDAEVKYTVTQKPEVEYIQNGSAHSCLLMGTPRYHIAMDGSTYTYLRVFNPQLLDKLTQRGTIFARMLPELKVRLIEQYQELGYRVGMCGDGANDCGALKTANTGMSLSTAEASVASPFTSSKPDIQCVPALIREGRCALVSSFGLFKFLLGCSWVFCIAVLILYKVSCDLTDVQYMYLDVLMITIPSILIANTGAYHCLAKTPPPPNLTDFTAIASLIGYIILQTLFISGAWIYLHFQPWYIEWNNKEEDFSSFENTLVFSTMGVSFAFAAMVFSRGAPYRKRFFTNKSFALVCLLVWILAFLILVKPPQFVTKSFGIYKMPMQFKLILLLIAAGNLILSVLFEDMFINKLLHESIIPWYKKIRGPSLPYQVLEEEMGNDSTWPPFHPSLTSNDITILENPLQDISTKTESERNHKQTPKGVNFSQSQDSVAVQSFDNTKLRSDSGIKLKNQNNRLSSSFAVLNTDSFMAQISKSMSALDRSDSELKLWKGDNRRSYIMKSNGYL